MQRVMALFFCLLLFIGCSQKASEDETSTPMKQHQRDSTIAASELPGAGAVGRALEIADSASARASRTLPETE